MELLFLARKGSIWQNFTSTTWAFPLKVEDKRGHFQDAFLFAVPKERRERGKSNGIVNETCRSRKRRKRE